MRDLENGVGVQQIVDPVTASGTTDITSEEIDTQKFNGLCLRALFGESGDTLSGTVYVEAEVQHSNTSGSGYAACANSDLTTYVTGTNTGTFAKVDAAAEDDAVYTTQYIGNKRYVKVIFNLTGTHTNGIPVAALAEKLVPKYPPVS